MGLPSVVLAAGWIPFVVIIALTLVFSFFYIRYYMSKYDSELSSTIIAILSLSVALLTSALVPVDIFLVSFMKTGNDSFKEWANNATRQSLESSVLLAYYSLYAMVIGLVFFFLPFAYFYHGEKEEDKPKKARCCTAFKFTLVFLIFAVVLFIMGAFIPKAHSPVQGSTEWKKIQALFESIGSNNGEDSLSFVISCLTLLGMVLVIFYTAYGMTALPMNLIRGHGNVSRELSTVVNKRQDAQSSIAAIKDKYRGAMMPRQERRRLADLEEAENLMARQERHLTVKDKSCAQKCLTLLRPFQIIFGVLFFLFAILIVVSLLLTNIDKAMHSLGYKMGYALPRRHLPNPIDIVLVLSQKAFPLDYILMAAILMYFVFCSIAAIRDLGILCLCVRMYKIRPRRTNPQALLMFCFYLMFIILAINITIYELTPQYSTFGSQKYVNSTTKNHVSCSTEVPGECVMTRISVLLTRFFYKMWFFGAVYYWGTWVFLGMCIVSFVVVIVRRKHSPIEGEVDRDDIDESDEELVRE